MEEGEENNGPTNEETPADPPSKTEDLVRYKQQKRGIDPPPLPHGGENETPGPEPSEQGKDRNIKVISDDEEPGGEQGSDPAPDPDPKIDDNEVEGALKLFDIMAGLGLAYYAGDVRNAKQYRADKEDLDDMKEDAREAMQKMGVRVHPYIRTASGVAKAYSHKAILAHRKKGNRIEDQDEGDEKEERERERAQQAREVTEEEEPDRSDHVDGKNSCAWCGSGLSEKQIKEKREFCSRKCSARYRAANRDEAKRVKKWKEARKKG
jgi:hypothetical protein